MTRNDENEFYTLDPAHVDPARLRKEREKARKLRKSHWWISLANRGICHYCERRFPAAKLTMDHVVPLARGGSSNPGNIVPSCPECNRSKKLETPAERLLKQLETESAARNESSPDEGEDDRND